MEKEKRKTERGKNCPPTRNNNNNNISYIHIIYLLLLLHCIACEGNKNTIVKVSTTAFFHVGINSEYLTAI